MATKVQNVDRLKRKLKAFPEAVRDEIRKAMEQGAEEIVAMAKSLVPVDDGTLRDSIGWTWGDPPKGSITLVSNAASRTGNMRLTIYAGNSEAFYARWVEFGTRAHSVRKGAILKRNRRQRGGTQHPGSTAQPFFYSAYRANAKRAKSRVTRAVNKAAKRVANSS